VGQVKTVGELKLMVATLQKEISVLQASLAKHKALSDQIDSFRQETMEARDALRVGALYSSMAASQIHVQGRASGDSLSRGGRQGSLVPRCVKAGQSKAREMGWLEGLGFGKGVNKGVPGSILHPSSWIDKGRGGEGAAAVKRVEE
jgi:hypothetical protein